MTKIITQSKRKSLRRRIFEEKLSVSPYFLHHHEDNNEAEMLLVNFLSLKMLGAYPLSYFDLKSNLNYAIYMRGQI